MRTRREALEQRGQPPVHDQGTTGASVAFAMANATQLAQATLGSGAHLPPQQPLGDVAAPPPAPASIFFTAHAKGAKPGELAPDMHSLVERLFRRRPMDQEYAELESALTVGEGRNDFGTLREALDKAEERSRRAYQLYIDARLEQERWLLDTAATLGALRAKASALLEDEKAAGDRRKAITDADVEAKMAEVFPDEVKHQKLERLRVKSVVESMEHLAERWKSKCSDLRTLLETARR